MIHPHSCSWAGLHFAPSHLNAWRSPGRASHSDKLNLTQPKLSSSRFHLPHWSPAHRCASTSPTPHEPLGRVGSVGPEQPCMPAAPTLYPFTSLHSQHPAQGQQGRQCSAVRAQPGREKPGLSPGTTLRLLPGTRLGMQQAHRV